MLRRWQKMQGAIRRAGSSCSLLALVATCLATDWASEARRIESLPDREVPKAVRALPGGSELPAVLPSTELRSWVWRKALAAVRDEESSNAARQIRRNALYRDEQRSDSNWLNEALERFGRWLEKLFGNRRANVNPNLPVANGLQWFTNLVWAILGIGIAVFGFLAVRFFVRRGRVTRKSKAVLDDDEPVRTLDEWLAEADELERQGRHREAVRALYLACLLRFDQHGVARFERSETNWEHLRRISASPNLPDAIDFRPTTQRFDLVWYGFRGEGQPDVAKFRAWYVEIVRALEERRGT